MRTEYVDYYQSPIGIVEITTTDTHVVSVVFEMTPKEPSAFKPAILKEAYTQLDAYFKGTQKDFTLLLEPRGTAFQKKVWEELLKIPYGETRSYKQIAEAIENPKACRAVGGANNKNALGIIIPCHRVVGADCSLIGYGGGLDRKRWLLEHETRYTLKQ